VDIEKTGKFPAGAVSPKMLTYNTYLKIPELTNLQKPISDPAAHDEVLFIVIHQVYELWFKLIGFELAAITKNISDDKLLLAYRGLDRVIEIFRVLVQQVDILETMSPVDFGRFRTNLNPASGFQSLQFREFEILSGADPAEYEKFSALEPEWKNQLAEIMKKQTLRSAFIDLLKKHKLVGMGDPQSIMAAISRIYMTESLQPLHNLCEYLIKYDEQILLWRFRHVQMVERMIGMRPGTGGSLGVPYLRQTLKKRFFPELWEARTYMGPEY